MELVTDKGRPPGPGDAAFEVVVDGKTFSITNPVSLGRQLLSVAGREPVDAFVLIELVTKGTRSIGLDEPIDLRAPGREAFQTFESDRIFRFTLNDRGYEWGTGLISEPDLRRVGDVPGNQVILLEREGEKDKVLGPADTIDLAKKGTERLRTEKRLITVFFDGEPKKIAAGVYTTEELIKALDVPAGYLLNVKDEHGKLVPLKPGEKIRVHEGMAFFTQVPCGGSS
jgi:Multiubiquitin